MSLLYKNNQQVMIVAGGSTYSLLGRVGTIVDGVSGSRFTGLNRYKVRLDEATMLWFREKDIAPPEEGKLILATRGLQA